MLFRALAGRRMADTADHVPLLSSALVWLLCRPEDLGSSVWSPIAQLLTHGCLTLNGYSQWYAARGRVTARVTAEVTARVTANSPTRARASYA